MLLEAMPAPSSLFLIKASVYTLLNITVIMRIFLSLCTELPLCFKEEFSVVHFQPGGIRRTFDTPPPRQLIKPSFD